MSFLLLINAVSLKSLAGDAVYKASPRLAAVFFSESTSSQKIRAIYSGVDEPTVPATTTSRRLRLLIVPGHEPGYGGAEYGSLKEREMAVEIALYLEKFLESDKKVEIILARDNEKWNPELENYVSAHSDEILAWRGEKEREMVSLIREGAVKKEPSLPHADAKKNSALYLYGINKWANEKNFDMIVHLHFNDYPGHSRRSGEYDGYTIYIPDKQYSNAKASRDLADVLRGRFSRFLSESNQPHEDSLTEDQELIALGSFNTLNPASVLIEYGYIYEPQFKDRKTREFVLREYAHQTFLGIEDYLTNREGEASFSPLPFVWQNKIKPWPAVSAEVFALQTQLIKNGFYPPEGKTLRDCPATGIFGDCTKKALNKFQAENNIKGENNSIGKETISFLGGATAKSSY